MMVLRYRSCDREDCEVERKKDQTGDPTVKPCDESRIVRCCRMLPAKVIDPFARAEDDRK